MSDIAKAARELAGELYELGDPEDERISDVFLRFADKIERSTPAPCDEVRLCRMLDDMRWAIEAHPGSQITGVDADCVRSYIDRMRR